MMEVAYRRLGDLGDERLRVLQERELQRSPFGEMGFQRLRGQAKSLAVALHDGPVRRRFAAHEERDTHHPVIPDEGQLCRIPTLRDVEKRNDALYGEIH